MKIKKAARRVKVRKKVKEIENTLRIKGIQKFLKVEPDGIWDQEAQAALDELIDKQDEKDRPTANEKAL